ncbi:PP2C family protein-serine/threonine phosphatase [uncultured Rubinisphaera sp.]|uniref:PP2C family protein-serine/threonine phosphatase n=1 Tax=uncultured Rubinisphaera sp. TaxID=1678686 RepID=UPI0030DCC10F
MTEPSWEKRLEVVYEMMHEMSRQTEAQAMVRAYAQRIGKLFPSSRRISLSRRELSAPQYRITRYSEWADEVDPWKQKDRLPLLREGLLAELLYSNRPHIIDDLQVDPKDPAAEYLEGQRSLMAIPMLDNGEALNMVITTQTEPYGFDKERFPDTFWMANLFGRATHNLVLKEEVRNAYVSIDQELKAVSEIQQSLLPKSMPLIPGLELAAYYQTSHRAGGDYYDFFPLCDGRWGFLIADVSGHGTPAAVVMAITHSIAHLYPGEVYSPSELLTFVNQQLSQRYTSKIEAFVTAFYAIYDPKDHSLIYASAGHNAPRLWRCSQQRIDTLDVAGGFPLGVSEDAEYDEATLQLNVGDRLVMYTDGITEAMDAEGNQFTTERLDYILNHSCRTGAEDLRFGILAAVDKHTRGAAATDDRTLVVATVH